MSRKNVLKTYSIIANQPMNSNITSDITDITYLDNVGVQLSWTTSDAYGDFAIQVSLDGETWNSINLPVNVSASGISDSAYIDLNQLSATQIRVVYTSTSGDGYCDGYIAAKMI